MAATEEGVFVGDTMARNWRPAGGHVIGLSHEGLVASRRIGGGDWMPLGEALSGPRAFGRE
jgi:hypothetical protein